MHGTRTLAPPVCGTHGDVLHVFGQAQPELVVDVLELVLQSVVEGAQVVPVVLDRDHLLSEETAGNHEAFARDECVALVLGE